MSWTRPHNWNNGPQYDSADLPFSPPTNDAGYIESGTPFWKLNSFSEMDKTYPANPAAKSNVGKEQYQSTLVKLFGVANSFSQEDLSASSRSQMASDAGMLTVDDYRRMTQSLPATPFTTPATTPAPTPGPTPQSSPLVPRKNIAGSELPAPAQQQQSATSNTKWWFFPQPSTGQTAANNTSNGSWIASVRLDGSSLADKSIPPGQDPVPSQSCRRKCAPLISNRDVNFFAPTSM